MRGGGNYLEKIESLSDDKLAEELRSTYYEFRSAFHRAVVSYRDGKHVDGNFSMGVYSEKLGQYYTCEMIYLKRIGVDRGDTDKVKGVLNTLLCSSNVSKTDVVTGSESPEVCAQVHAEAARDDGEETIENVADTAVQAISETEDVTGSESPEEVCAEIHAEAANDDDFYLEESSGVSDDSYLEEEYDVPEEDPYLEEIRSLSDDELVEKLRSAYDEALAAYDTRIMSAYAEKLTQYVVCKMTYLERVGIDRNDTAKVSSVINPLLGKGKVANVVATEGQCAGNILKVRSVLNLLIDSYGNIVENADKGGVDRNNDDQVSSVLDQVSDSGKVVDTVSVRSV